MGKRTRRSIIYEDPQGNIKTLDVTAPLGKDMNRAINEAIKELAAQGRHIVKIPKPTNGKSSTRNRRRL